MVSNDHMTYLTLHERKCRVKIVQTPPIPDELRLSSKCLTAYQQGFDKRSMGYDFLIEDKVLQMAAEESDQSKTGGADPKPSDGEKGENDKKSTQYVSKFLSNFNVLAKPSPAQGTGGGNGLPDMKSQNPKLARMVSITASDPATCQIYLERCNMDIQKALQKFYSENGL
eukprot:CAMPEP_0194295186 /NCGR_PEP_ID=MMETSP0169-20130528/52800_1 /TAXON_ID=218684 /ORGANISM="Corethron pennatum, Strain L29A3" /LENGTH=169 /DNA_ID=CAMNT_0039044297 /DNA_START=128 /DNA_END=637 /DNA_ORIENTATION=-